MRGTSKGDIPTEMSRGTTSYRAPELKKGQYSTYNQKTDVWALGCILSEIITSKRFSENDVATADEVTMRKSDPSRFPISDDLLVDARSRAVILGSLGMTLEGNSKLRPTTVPLMGLFAILDKSETTVWLDGCEHRTSEGMSLPRASAAASAGVASAVSISSTRF